MFEYKKIYFLIGPSKSGKSAFFIANRPNGIIVTNREKIDFHIPAERYLNISQLSHMNINEKEKVLEKYSCTDLLIYGTHLLNELEFYLIKKIKTDNLYISFVTGTWENTPLEFQVKPKKTFFSNKKVSNANTIANFFRIDKIWPRVYIFMKPCKFCQDKTISNFQEPYFPYLNDVKAEDIKYFACCLHCKYRRQPCNPNFAIESTYPFYSFDDIDINYLPNYSQIIDFYDKISDEIYKDKECKTVDINVVYENTLQSSHFGVLKSSFTLFFKNIHKYNSVCNDNDSD